MELTSQFSVFLVNKPGVLAQVTRQIAMARINVLAMTLADSSEHGVLRLVVDAPGRLREALARLNLPTTETEVLVVALANRSGALADLCQKLADAHINISYAYCTTGAQGGKTNGVFKVADNKKAMKVLQEKGPKRRDAQADLRRPAVLR
ncbi:MAG TPA: ACT domain-containing protein [Phycisphaerae bacterium]|nr:ACT domain-containing protein [Phycisphaerae bacterium]HRY71027.1 ACT domain-containing protein [Phycisphaerae bacterium]HSA29361.1 ACT domain-containing protein [Phycisphaerae bacterium]